MSVHSWTVPDLIARVALSPAEWTAHQAWIQRWTTHAAPAVSGTWAITGANGALGRHLARTLLRQGQDVVGVVRGTLDHPGLLAALTPTASLRAEAKAHRWADRLQVIRWDQLDTFTPPPAGLAGVFHSAADMSLARSAEALWASNVTLTQQAMAWTQRIGARRFDHISTLSVWVAGETATGRCAEHGDLVNAGRLHGGYAATKWASDWALPGWARSMPLAIHRLGLLTGGDEGPLAHDPILATALAWRRWGAPLPCPATAHQVAFDASPIATVAAAVVHLARHGAQGPFHEAGRQAITGAQWWQALAAAWGEQAGHWPADDPLGKYARRAWGRWLQPDRQRWWMDLFQSSQHTYDDARARAHGIHPWTTDPLAAARGLALQVGPLSR